MNQDQAAMTEQGAWSKIELAGHPCQVYEPQTPSKHGYTLLYLHGRYQGIPADRPRMMQHLAPHGLRIIAPLTKRSWWADRICTDFDPDITPEQYLLQQVLPYVAERWRCEPPRLALMGASMGGQGALRLAYKYPEKFPVVTAFFPSIDFQIRIEEGDRILSQMYRDVEDARQDTATLHIHPLNWPRHQWFCCDPADLRWHDSVDRLRMKLFSLGVPHECDLETSAGGHTWEYVEHMTPRAVEFMMQALEQERLRVV
ncbi:MAG: esterase [Pirellulales bacterium]|nr:esterase [Pirellulales bacterium]